MERARRAAGVHEELVHVLERIEAVRAAPAEDVDVQAVRLGEQQVRLGRDEREALEEADADAAVLDDVCDGEGGGLDVLAAADDLEVRADGAEVLVGGLVGEVAEADGLGDLARGEELLELAGGCARGRCVSQGRSGWMVLPPLPLRWVAVVASHRETRQRELE